MIKKLSAYIAAALVGITLTTSPALASVDKVPFHKTMGAFAIGDQDKVAALNGYTYTPAAVNPAYSDEGVSIVASGIRSKMYNTLCNGHGDCADYTSANEQIVLDYAASYVQQHKDNPAVVGWYVLDDPWTDFSSTLAKVAQVIRAHDQTKPMVCALQLDLKSTLDPNPLRYFRNRVAPNFSPDWCDVFTIYSYAKEGASAIEWNMANTLPQAIQHLKDYRGLLGNGGPGSNSKRLGTPSAFGGGGFAQPTKAQLRLQTRSFCENGITGLLPYAWNDGYIPDRASLANTYDLRQGMREGLSDCQVIWN